MTTSTTTTAATTARKTALLVARVVAGVLGLVGLAGATYFMLIAPEESVWVGPWLDVPVVALIVSAVLVKLVVAVAPGLPASRRIAIGLAAFPIMCVVTLAKVTFYSEPESLVLLTLDAVLFLLLVRARRVARRRGA